MHAPWRTRIVRRFRRDQRGVSPVIGTVLVLFIVLVAMAGIMAWGVPAIRGLQDHAEYQSVLTQVIQASQDVRVLRDPQTTRNILISMNHGQLRVEEGARWVVTVHTDAAHTGITVAGWETDSSQSVTLTGVPASQDVTADRVTGGTFTNAVTTTCTTTCNLALGYQVNDNVTRIQVRSGGVLKSESWIFEGGRLSYSLYDRDTYNQAHLEMGAVIAQQGDAYFLEEAPTIKEPLYSTEPKDTSFLFRALQLEGGSSASGKGRHTIHAHLVDNYGVTRGRPDMANATSVRIQIDDGGLLEEAFCSQFLRNAYYTEANGNCADGDANVLYDPPNTAATNYGGFSFSFSQAVVNVNLHSF